VRERGPPHISQEEGEEKMSQQNLEKELKRLEDETLRKRLELKRLELKQVERELERKRKDQRAQHDADIVSSMDEEQYTRYFNDRDAREKRMREEEEIAERRYSY
jgi:hypothetical protein